MSEPVTLRFRGLMAEKFLERAAREGICVGSARRLNAREVILKADEADAAQLMALARKYALDVCVTDVRGLPKLRRRVRERASLLIALGVALALLVLTLSGRVWRIDVRLDDSRAEGGIDAEAQWRVERALEALGVMPGMSTRGLDTRQLALDLQREAGDLAYVGVRLDGARLSVQAVCELPQPEVYNPAAARDLVAARDGVVVSVNALAGAAAVKPGDTVRAGQVLIRGEERATDELTRGVCALGEVVARAWVTGESAAPTRGVEEVPTGRSAVSTRLRVLDRYYLMEEGENYALQWVETEWLPVGGLLVPLGILRETHTEYARREAGLELGQVKREISENALNIAISRVPQGCSVVDKWVDYSMIEGDIIRARAVVEFQSNIAVAREALDPGGS